MFLTSLCGEFLLEPEWIKDKWLATSSAKGISSSHPAMAIAHFLSEHPAALGDYKKHSQTTGVASQLTWLNL